MPRNILMRYPLPWRSMGALTIIQLSFGLPFVLFDVLARPWAFSVGNKNLVAAWLYLCALAFCFSALVLIVLYSYRALFRPNRYVEFVGMILFLCALGGGLTHFFYFGGYPGWRAVAEIFRSPDFVIGYLVQAGSVWRFAATTFVVAVFAAVAWWLSDSTTSQRLSPPRVCLMFFVGCIPILTCAVGGSYPSLAQGYHPIFNSSLPQFRLLASAVDSLLNRDLSIVAGFLPSSQNEEASRREGVAKPPDHLVLVVMDSLRADRFPGDSGLAAPFRWPDEIELEMVPFTRFYTQAPFTGAAFATMFSSRYLADSVERKLATELSSKFWNSLREAGYQTAFLSATDVEWDSLSTVISASDADTFIDRHSLPRAELDNDWAILPFLRKFLERAKGAPTFSVLFLVRTHFPYTSKIRPDARDLTDEQRYVHGVEEFGEWLHALARIFEEHDSLDSTAVIVTSDHGESFGAHGIFGHGYSMVEEQLKVPFVISSGKSVELPKVRTDCLHSHVDLVPSVLDLLGIETFPESQGISLFSGRCKDYEIMPYSSLVKQVAVIRGEEKFVYDVDAARAQHFNLADDSRESRNLWTGMNPGLELFLERATGRIGH